MLHYDWLRYIWARTQQQDFAQRFQELSKHLFFAILRKIKEKKF